MNGAEDLREQTGWRLFIAHINVHIADDVALAIERSVEWRRVVQADRHPSASLQIDVRGQLRISRIDIAAFVHNVTELSQILRIRNQIRISLRS